MVTEPNWPWGPEFNWLISWDTKLYYSCNKSAAMVLLGKYDYADNKCAGNKPWSLWGVFSITSLLSSSALRFFLALGISSASSVTLGGLLLPRSVCFPLSFSFSRSLSLCFLDFFLTFLLVLLDKGGLVMTVEVTVSEVRGGGLGEEAVLGIGTGWRKRSCRVLSEGKGLGEGSLQEELWSMGRSWVPQPSGVLGELVLEAGLGCWWEGAGGWEEMGRWVGGPEVMEGRDERLELGLPSSSWRSEEEDEDAAGPRLLRWEMRAFLGANGSMKSKSDCRFCQKTILRI